MSPSDPMGGAFPRFGTLFDCRFQDETLEHPGQDAGSQVGELLAIREHEEPGVVDDHAEASGPLAG